MKNSHESIPQPNAEATIMNLMQQASVMGANDYELPTLSRILKDLREKRITDQTAIEKAQGILDNKQDYH